ncbi:hypothetical protein B0H14DRAFT_3124168 [Mycena olivaceomarginata]|nr:hypothetical protein B0H14DRAFT_3124168 [Mycena olivaceomarginata]
MAPRAWATAEQQTWLRGRLAEFIKRQAEGKLHLFWAPMNEAWFKVFPEHTHLNLPLPNTKDARQLTPDELTMLGAAILVRKGKLENWFRNQRKKVGNANAPAEGATMSIIQRILKLNVAKRRRAHQPIEIFQKRNAELIKAALTKAVLTEAGDDDLMQANQPDEPGDCTDATESTVAARSKRHKSERMRLRTRVVHELWAAALDEERKLVEEEVEREKQEIQEEELRREKEAEAASMSPSEQQENIDALDGAFAEIHKSIFDATKWVGLTLVGGPNPRMGGELTLKVIAFGRTAGGNDFEDCCIDFDHNVLAPFQDFLRLCYSAQDRQVCAFVGQTTTISDDESPAERVFPPAPPAQDAENPNKKKSKTKKSKSKSKATAADPEAASPTPSPPVLDAASPSVSSGLGDANIVGGAHDSLRSPENPAGQRSNVSTAADDIHSGALIVNPGNVVTNWFDNIPPFGGDGIGDDGLGDDGLSSEGFGGDGLGSDVFGVNESVAIATRGIDDPPPRLWLPESIMMGGAPTASVSPTQSQTYTRPPPRPAYKSAALFGNNVPRGTIAARALQSLLTAASSPSPSPSAPNPLASADGLAIPDPTALPLPQPSKTPLATIPNIAPTPSPPATASPITLATGLVMPRSRPPAKAPTLVPPPWATMAASETRVDTVPAPRPPNSSATPPPAHKAPAKKPAPKKGSAAAKADKREAAASAAADAPKKRGRPRKQPLNDITNEVQDTTNASTLMPPATDPLSALTPPAANASSALVQPPAPSNAPIHVYSSTNNNRTRARAAAVADEAAKEKEKADAVAKQAAKGWFERTVDGVTVVTFTRVRKPVKLPDGSAVQREVKGTRKKACPVEEAMLARAAAAKTGSKRKAAQSAAPRAPKKK